jgi:hypothetical protein
MTVSGRHLRTKLRTIFPGCQPTIAACSNVDCKPIVAGIAIIAVYFAATIPVRAEAKAREAERRLRAEGMALLLIPEIEMAAVGVYSHRLNARARLHVYPSHPRRPGCDSEYPKASDFT